MASPTIVLVHGAFSDASSWRPVFDQLDVNDLQGRFPSLAMGPLAVAPELHHFSCDGAGSTVTEVEGASHFVMMSQGRIVAGSFARQSRPAPLIPRREEHGALATL